MYKIEKYKLLAKSNYFVQIMCFLKMLDRNKSHTQGLGNVSGCIIQI